MAKRSFINMEDEEEEQEQEEEEEEEEETESEYDDCGGDGDDRRKKVMIRLVCAGSHQSQVQGMREPSAKMRLSSSTCCQADECGTNLRMEKVYHQKHKVCERHSKAPVVLVNGIRQRFCQQCSKFHELSEFDHMKRSCRQKLAGHNERRRKSQLDMQVESREKPHSSQTPLSF